jgi:hypothetical protein
VATCQCDRRAGAVRDYREAADGRVRLARAVPSDGHARRRDPLEGLSMLRNLIAVVAGVIVGGVVNMGLITVGTFIIPPPPGVDMTTAEGLQAGIALIEPRHFLFPFLAHALGTLAGALVAARLACRHRVRLAMVVGAVFLFGGIMAARMIPAPTWFVVLDLVVAYIPMAWLGGRLAPRGGRSA